MFDKLKLYWFNSIARQDNHSESSKLEEGIYASIFIEHLFYARHCLRDLMNLAPPCHHEACAVIPLLCNIYICVTYIDH